MGKKVREYKSGDFIFAKVKGYPAWPARVQRPNGKKYFVYFYGTGETANLPPNMIFDYAENKEKFLTKSVKRRDFNDGVKQIEYDFANNVPLEDVIGVPVEAAAEAPANETANDSAIDATLNDSAADTTANDTVAEDVSVNASQNDATVEDSDDAGALVIDEGKTPAKGRKSKAEAKPKDSPKPKEAKTPRGKAKKEEAKEEDGDELISRSGRKIRPKRYIDEQTEENATLPSPASKRRRGASPTGEKEKTDANKEKADTNKESAKEKKDKVEKDKGDKGEKSVAQFNVVRQSELEGLKEAFKPADEDKENILIVYLPVGAYAGIRLFQSRPRSFKNEAARLQWDKQAARNALTLKMQLEREHITPESVQAQLVLNLNLTDEEKATLDKERETEEKKSRVNFLKTEMKLIELDVKIKNCLNLENPDTELCLKLLDEILLLEVKPLMLLKHPSCLETVKRMRAYVGNTPSWDLNETNALAFSKQAHKIRKKADLVYKSMKEHFEIPEGLSFWEYFTGRVAKFKEDTAKLNAGQLLQLVHEPVELSQPNAHTMRSAIDEANKTVPPLPDSPEMEEEEEKQTKKKTPAAKSKKPPPTPSKKRTRANKKEEPENETPKPEESEQEGEKKAEENGEEGEKEKADKGDNAEATEEAEKETPAEPEAPAKETSEDVEMAEPTEKAPETEDNQTEGEKETETPDESEAKKSKTDKPKDTEKSTEKSTKKDKKAKEASEKSDSSENNKEDKEEDVPKEVEKKDKKNSKESKESAKNGKEREKSGKDNEKSGKNNEKSGKDNEKSGKESGKDNVKEKEDAAEDKSEKEEKSEDKDSMEPRAKRSREPKKTEPPPTRSPTKRKSKV